MSEAEKTALSSRRRITVLIVAIVMVSAIACCTACRLRDIERFTIVIPIADPPNSESRVTRSGGYLTGEFIWHKEYWIDANSYDDEVIEEYFNTYLLSNGWKPAPSVVEERSPCMALAGIQPEETENVISNTYVLESWSVAIIARPELACVVVIFDPIEQIYHVHLITENPTLLSQLLV